MDNPYRLTIVPKLATIKVARTAILTTVPLKQQQEQQQQQ